MKLLGKKLCILILLLFSLRGLTLAQQQVSTDTTPVKQQIHVSTDTAFFLRQTDLIDELKRLFKMDQKKIDSQRLKKKFQFSIIPVAGAVPGGGAAIATAFNAAFYTGPDSTTSLSTIIFSPWFSFDGKFVLPFRSLIWLPNDLLLSKGDTRYMIYPQYTWGLGSNTNDDDKLLIKYNYLRVYHSFLRKAGKKIFFGAGYNLDYHYNAILEDTLEKPDIPFYDYEDHIRENSVSSGVVINFLVDSRRNSLNPRGGVYFAADYRINPEFLGSTNSWQSILADFRKYFSFDKKRQNILAFWTYYWGVTNGRAPYLDLPSIGWDAYNRSGRGYEQNRYRGKQLIYFESEYRKDITKNGFFGFVLFANLHTVSEYQHNNFVYWHPAAGAGLRIKFNKISRTNIGMDLGFSKDFVGFYLTLGEAF